MPGGVLHILALQTARTSEAALPTASVSFPAGRTLGKRIPYTRPSFPLAFSKDQKTERTGRLANPNGEPPSRSASSGWLQPTTPNPIDRGKPQGKEGFLQRDKITECRLQGSTGGGGCCREDFPATQRSSKSSLCMTPVAHRREFL